MEIKIGDWKIRSFSPRDTAALVKYANNRNVWINLRDSFPLPYTEKDARAWVHYARNQNPESNFAIARGEELIGAVGLVLQADVQRLSAELGYWLAEPFWGKGIATKAVQAFTEFAFANFDLVRIYAYVFEWNRPSAKVLEKAGYRLEGRLEKSVIKDGQIIDQFLYALIREDVR